MTLRSLNRRPLAALVAATSLFSLTCAGTALAQSPGEAMALEEEESTGVDLGEDDEAEEAALVEDEQSEFPQDEFPDEGATPEDTPEKHRKGDTQLLIGARYRMMITPKWLINMFGVEGGKTLLLNGIGGEVGGYWGGDDRNGLSVYGSVTYIGYGMEPTPFKGKNDPPSDWEVFESNLGAVYLVGDFLWDYKLIDKLSLNLGFSAGVGIVTGKLYRTETYDDPTNPEFPSNGDWPNLSACLGPGNPSAGQCPPDGNYGEQKAWPVYPWLNGQIGLRYQPIDEFVARLELGLGSSGFWLGLGADYAHFL